MESQKTSFRTILRNEQQKNAIFDFVNADKVEFLIGLKGPALRPRCDLHLGLALRQIPASHVRQPCVKALLSSQIDNELTRA